MAYATISLYADEYPVMQIEDVPGLEEAPPRQRLRGIFPERESLCDEIRDTLAEGNANTRIQKYFTLAARLKALAPGDIAYGLAKQELHFQAARERCRERCSSIGFLSLLGISSIGLVITPIVAAALTGSSSEAFNYFRGMTAGSVIQLAIASGPVMTAFMYYFGSRNKAQLNAQGLLAILEQERAA